MLYHIRTIYEKLAGAFSEEQRGMYLQRAEEITPNIRYCAYNLDEGETDISELMDLRMHTTGGPQDLLTSKIDVRPFQSLYTQVYQFSELP